MRLVALLLALVSAALLVLGLAPSVSAQPPAPMGTGEIEIALRKLLVVGNVLYVAAHPDDENTAMLAWLSKGRKVRTAYLSITRGDGGQNLIGSERGDRMGVIRTQELLAARRVDGAEQFFTRAIDFGYSRGPVETLSIWGKEAVLSDVVRVYRTFRPDVVVCRFPANGAGGHGHHTASALLAEEAFLLAGDATKFHEQITNDGLTPWQPRRLFWNAWRVDPAARDPKLSKLIPVDLGAYDPFLGRSYSEIAGEGRSMHKSQGFGAAERRGTLMNWLEPLAGEPAEKDLLDGIDVTWTRVPGGEGVAATLEEAVRVFRPEVPSAVLPILLRARRQMAALPAKNPWVEEKRRELLDVIRAVTGLWLEAITPAPEGACGSEVKVAVLALKRSSVPASVRGVSVSGAPALETATVLAENVPWRGEAVRRIPSDVAQTDPYWLREKADGGLYRVANPREIGRPGSAPALSARFDLDVAGELLSWEVPVEYRWTDPVKGERYRPFAVVPKVSLHLEGPVLLFPDGKPRDVAVTVRGSKKDVSGTAGLRLPAGWTASPALPFHFSKEGEETILRFTVTPPAGISAGTLRAMAVAEGESFSRDLVRLDYPHLPVQVLTPPAEAVVVRRDVRVAGKKAGYVMGSGDEVPEALRQLGFDVTLLSDEDLSTAGLSRFDVIVTGVRAYNTRQRLKVLQPALMDYVKGGGTLVVQYNTAGELVVDSPGPFPLTLSRDRVTDETAKVTFLDPKSPVLRMPNRIIPSDFDGWVQERGLYYPGKWDPRYEAVLGMADPGEKETRGALLVVRHGGGTFVYTGLAFFRQLPAGVPGAWALFANVVSAGKAKWR